MEPERASRAWARERVRLLLVETLVEGLTGALAILASPVLAPRWRRRIRALLGTRVAPAVDDPGPAASGAPRIFLVAGEPSGDQRASDLVREVLRLAPGARLEGFGGDRMEEAGVRLHVRMDEHPVMGFLGVIGRIGTFVALLTDLLERLRRDPPDVLVLVDYPGFNLRAARAARPLLIPTVQVVSPQVWAWAPWRIPRIARSVDRILAVLPFEPPLFTGTRARVTFTGHPLVERVERDAAPPWRTGGRWVGLLPGSRRQEVERLLPLMLSVAARLRERDPDARFVVPVSGPAVAAAVERILRDAPVPVEVVAGRTSGVLRSLRTALVASGTATLELGLHGVPMVVVYPITSLQRWLRPALLIAPYFALANLAAGTAVVEERLVRGGEAEAAAIAESLARIHRDGPERERARAGLAAIRDRLSGPGAAERAARAVLAAAGEGEARGAGRAPRA